MEKSLLSVTMFLATGVVSPLDRLSIDSFVRQGHLCQLYSYQPPNSPIPGCTYLDAATIIPEKHYRALYRNAAPYAERWFRWELAACREGWISTTDFICLRPLDFKKQLVFAYEDKNHVCDELFCCPGQHTITRTVLRRYRHPEYFPLDGLRKMRAMLNALYTARRTGIRLTDAQWLGDNSYLSIYVLSHKSYQQLLAPYQLVPWNKDQVLAYIDKDAPPVDDTLIQQSLSYSHALKLHRTQWHNPDINEEEVTAKLSKLIHANNANSTNVS